jgi:hypothetical protein
MFEWFRSVHFLSVLKTYIRVFTSVLSRLVSYGLGTEHIVLVEESGSRLRLLENRLLHDTVRAQETEGGYKKL